jgi:hypothetical protein
MGRDQGEEVMANETKWTPGPWRVDRGPRGSLGIWAGAGDDIVASIEKRGETGEADARLVAAAPEMAGALHDLLRAAERMPMATVNEKGTPCCSYCRATHETHGNGHGPLCIIPGFEAGISVARAALARARGES